ncbi:MAG: protein-disulfide reductase DsbD family protein [Phycisphaerales bacterium]
MNPAPHAHLNADRGFAAWRPEGMTALAWLGAGVILAGCAAHATAAREAKTATAGVPLAGLTHAQVEVLLPRAVVPGDRMDVGVKFTIEKDWHLYWNGQNDSGTPMAIELKLPAGFKAKETLWPAPERLVEPGGILNHVYEREVILIVPIEVAKDAKVGPVEISVESKWLACKEACVPESGGAKATMKVDAVPADQAALYVHEAVAKARAALPIELAKDDPRVKIVIEGRRATIQAPGAKEIALMPGPESSQVKNLGESGVSKGNQLTVEFEEGQIPIRISGIVRVTNSEGVRAYYHIDTHAGARPVDGQDRPVPGR